MSATASKKKPREINAIDLRPFRKGRRNPRENNGEIPVGMPSVIEGAFGPNGPVDSFGDFERAVREAKADPDFYVPKSELRMKVSSFFHRLERTSVYVLGRISAAALHTVDYYEKKKDA
jgi:hypothetical protein